MQELINFLRTDNYLLILNILIIVLLIGFIALLVSNMKLKEKQMKSRLLLQIHDELLIETHLDEFEEVKEILQNEMINAVSLRVPLNIDIEQGASWYEAK